MITVISLFERNKTKVNTWGSFENQANLVSGVIRLNGFCCPTDFAHRLFLGIKRLFGFKKEKKTGEYQMEAWKIPTADWKHLSCP